MNFITAVAGNIIRNSESKETSDFGLKSFSVVVWNRYLDSVNRFVNNLQPFLLHAWIAK